MVPAQKILDTAREVGADVIGLSGLITPSLDEMVNLAAEMQRQEFTIPLLIGGATTSRAHTAVKIDQKYDGPVVWVKDASRSVPITASLLSDDRRQKLLDDVQADYDVAADPPRGQERPPVGHPRAGPRASHAHRLVVVPPAAPAPAAPAGPRRLAHRGHPAAGDRKTQHVRVFQGYDLDDLRRYIDWQPFFNAWEMKGSFPDILNSPASGGDRAQALRRRPGDARPDRRRAVADRQRRRRPVPRQQRRRRHRGLPRRGPRSSR